MSFAEVRRNAVSAQLLTRLASEHGMSAQDCLRDTGISAEALAAPQTEISAGQELQLVRNLVARLGEVPALGLEAGSRYHLTTYGIWGYALASSPDYRSVWRIALRYLDLSYSFVPLRMVEHGGQLEILMDDSAVPEAVRPFLVERDFAALAVAGQEIRPGGFPILAAQFRFPRPSHAARYLRFTGVEPQFSASRNALRMDASFLDDALPQADAVVARICEEQCRQLLARRQVRTGVSGRVRDVLLRRPAQMPDAEAVARELCMSPRSLRRRLDEEQTSFRSLIDEVRQTLAEELLVTAQMKLEEVASRLGYSESASFIHAFRRWKGMSPREFRERQRKPGDAV